MPVFYYVVSDEEPAGLMRSFLAPDVLNQPKESGISGPYKHSAELDPRDSESFPPRL